MEPARVSTEQVWEQLSGQVLAFLRRRVRDEDTAVDLLQETFARVHSRLGELEDDTRVLAWVYRIARNLVVDHYRASGEERSRGETRSGVERAGEGSPVMVSEASEGDHLNDTVGRWLFEMLPALPDGYRDALELVEVEGLSQREVARRLGLSESGAKSRVQRGRRMLKSMLLDCCHLDLDGRGNVLDYAQRGRCNCSE